MIFRVATLADAAQITALHNLCIPKTPWSLALYEGEFGDELKHYFVAECDGRIVGFAGFAQVLDEGHIMNVAVAPEVRKQGIGRRLMDMVEQSAKALSITVVSLEARCSNIPAQSLYRAVGYMFLGVRPGYYSDNEGAAIFEKRI